jgi:hypothetical protein
MLIPTTKSLIKTRLAFKIRGRKYIGNIPSTALALFIHQKVKDNQLQHNAVYIVLLAQTILTAKPRFSNMQILEKATGTYIVPVNIGHFLPCSLTQ